MNRIEKEAFNFEITPVVKRVHYCSIRKRKATVNKRAKRKKYAFKSQKKEERSTPL